MRRPVDSAASGATLPESGLGKTLAKYPALRAFLAATSYEGSTDRRDPGKLIISWSGVALDVLLKEPSASLQMRLTLSGWDELLTVLEAALTNDKAPWMHDPWAKTYPLGRKKK